MVKIIDITEEEKEKASLLENKLKLVKKYFGIYGIVKDHGYGSFSIRKGEESLISMGIVNSITVYSKEIPDEKLLEFGNAYEEMFGVKNLEIRKDYSRS